MNSVWSKQIMGYSFGSHAPLFCRLCPSVLLYLGTAVPAIWFLDEKGEPLFQPIMGALDAENFYRALMLVKNHQKMLVETKYFYTM